MAPGGRIPPVQRQRDRRRAARVLGKPLKPSQHVHHHTLTQLVICQSRAYHVLLHRRERVLFAGGNPNTQRVCAQCHLPKRFDRFANSMISRCKPCTAAFDAEMESKAAERAVYMAKAKALNLITIRRFIKRELRNGRSYQYDLSVSYPELAPEIAEAARELYRRHLTHLATEGWT